MGTWRLEAAKMALYITFPIAMFHYFNQPHLFEEWVVETKRQIYPREDTPENARIREAIQKIKEKQDLANIKALENN